MKSNLKMMLAAIASLAMWQPSIASMTPGTLGSFSGRDVRGFRRGAWLRAERRQKRRQAHHSRQINRRAA